MKTVSDVQGDGAGFPGSIAPGIGLIEASRPPEMIALSRIEFEPANSENGTKVLMVEWDTSWPERLDCRAYEKETHVSHAAGPQWITKHVDGWEVSWQGTATALATSDRAATARKRVYFLLPPGARIPKLVRITHSTGLALTTNPLPAIFPEEFGVQKERKGVLRKLT